MKFQIFRRKIVISGSFCVLRYGHPFGRSVILILARGPFLGPCGPGWEITVFNHNRPFRACNVHIDLPGPATDAAIRRLSSPIEAWRRTNWLIAISLKSPYPRRGRAISRKSQSYNDLSSSRLAEWVDRRTGKAVVMAVISCQDAGSPAERPGGPRRACQG